MNVTEFYAGAAIPFGRSMTYRFAFAAFWAAVAMTDVQLEPPLNDRGAAKGFLLRHLRWWSQQSDMFNPDGTLSVGFAYPNMYMSEEYNSAQSVYWCLKSFIILGLPEDHAFWTCSEQGYPLQKSISMVSSATIPPTVEAVWPPRQILCNAPEHHFMLSSGQMTKKGHRAKEAKYCKFAYSSAFAFSVPSGGLLQQMAPDSTLCISVDNGDTWRVRSDPFDVRIEHAVVDNGDGLQKVPALVSSWTPGKMFGFEVETTLIPLVQQFPGWHIRIHRIRWLGDTQRFLLPSLQVVDAGFAVPALTAAGYQLPSADHFDDMTKEGLCSSEDSCLIRTQAVASGMIDLTIDIRSAVSSPGEVASEVVTQGHVVRADPNTNLMSQRTFIPSLKYQLPQHTTNALSDIWLASGIFAAAASPQAEQSNISRMWSNRPCTFAVDNLGVGKVFTILDS